MKIISIIGLYFISLSIAQAALEGDYVLTSNQKLCPSGSLSLKTIGKERYLLFGSQLSWTLNLEDKSEFIEAVKGGCTYSTTYEKTKDIFKAKTVRSKCPSPSENAVINEELISKNSKLTYLFNQVSETGKKTNYECSYKSSKK